MAYLRCGLTNALYRGTKISFVKHVNDLFMRYSVPLTLFAAVKTFADGVTAAFTVIPRSLICSHFLFASVQLPPLWVGQDDDLEGLLLIDDGFYLCFTEDSIYETN